MTTIDELEELVNWDHAAGTVASPRPKGSLVPELASENNLFDTKTSTSDNHIPNHNYISAPFPGPGAPSTDVDNIDLVLANVDEDDFSFCALEHFGSNSVMPGFPADNLDFDMDADMNINMDTTMNAGMNMSMNMEPPTMELEWETPPTPCAYCTMGNYHCKKIREGVHKGYCTSCVALGVDCSFSGPILESIDLDLTTLPSNPWPIMPDLSNSVPQEDLSFHESFQPTRSSSVQDLLASGNTSDNDVAVASAAPHVPPAKIGARFSRDSVRILKNWLTTHNRHPYPSDEEKEMLQRQTGLNKTQITNWLANARRRGKVQPPRATSPNVGMWASGPMEIPQRRGTPALESMNPLQRWQHSPPENEPASVTAIARAVTASSSGMGSSLESPFNYTDDGSSRSICNQSSASSLGTSRSSSKNSAYSHGSRNSWGSFGSAPFSKGSRRRRRRRASPHTAQDAGKSSLTAPPKTFQCTFCPETFRTKHDWQRHEKSLHLSLERWVCTPEGPAVINPDTGVMTCVFCGVANPDAAHAETHNHAACQERSLEERTFYRKDHLNQHLRLVHNAKFSEWSMKPWKVSTPQIRSRCGFCGIVMDTWTIRVDHLAEHFKTGYSMADWKGDWGFDTPVLDMIENSMPPCTRDPDTAADKAVPDTAQSSNV